jgi:endonuclease/exonuclease/phosphatase family metal-dependent hydrolase
MPRRLALALALLVFAALPAPTALAAAHPSAARTSRVTVMTRNLFLGANLIPLATTAPGAPFQQAVGQMFAGVQATDPDARMRLVAREIAKAKADLVGLQEVSLWRTGAEPATQVVYDYSSAIVKELRKRHAHYRLVALERGFNVEGPTDRGFDVRLTLGDAILARKGVKVSHVRSGVFKTQLTIPTQGVGPVEVTRGWNALDARIGKARLHFVNTHLEAYDAAVREEQAKELVAGPLKSRRTTLLVGDLNSGPDLTQPNDRLAYAAIARAGFKPERTAKPSCCFDDSLRTGAWDHNVDWIMAKPRLKLVRSSLTGAETTPAGLHPADHGGVLTTLRF